MANLPLLFYNELQAAQVQKKFEKVISFLREGNFRSAETKKMVGFPGIYRAKLDAENRLLFKFVRYESETYLLLLDVVLHHAYEKSRFLRGAEVDESRLPELVQAAQVPSEDIEELRFLAPKKNTVHFLNKALAFDEAQQSAFNTTLPLIIIGSAGSGKTALTLERMKHLHGNIAYITLSEYLSDNAQGLYFAEGYQNEKQEVDFLSFKQYLFGLRIPDGREVRFRDFDGLFQRHRQALKLREPYKLFEEFKGVITGAQPEKPYLSFEDYLGLGVRQSVYPVVEREPVYRFFEKYLQFLEEEKLYDTNLLAQSYQALVKPTYDFVVIDEVQDMTNTQLAVVLKSLKTPRHFLLCGDANQIVHPNFFSWAGLKSMFYASGDLEADIIRVLHTNYRNTLEVTELSNRILKLKNFRFGSIDRESTYLISPASGKAGSVAFLEDQEKLKQELNQRTRRSTRFAVVVMRDEDKAEAKRFFETPLVFSVQEAKGLEYDNVILYNFITVFAKEFRHIAEGVSPEDLEGELAYARARDKSDRELDTYKFYINALYVAITRSVQNLYIIEREQKHPLLQVLGLVKVQPLKMAQTEQSSDDEWSQEARRLERQGKREQSDAIRKLLAEQQRKVLLSKEELETLKTEALNPAQFNNQAKKRLFQYAREQNDFGTIEALAELKFGEARKFIDGINKEIDTYFRDCSDNKLHDGHLGIKKLGVDLSDRKQNTLLMTAVKYPPAMASVAFLAKKGANRQTPEGIDILAYVFDLYLKRQTESYLRDRTAIGAQAIEEAKMLGKLYQLLETPFIMFSAQGRLFKVNNQSMEYLLVFLMHHAFTSLVQLIWGDIQRRLSYLNEDDPYYREQFNYYNQGIQNQDFHLMISLLPSSIVPEYRRKTSYINHALAKNEINSTNPYGKALFQRMDKGLYAMNPELKIYWDGVVPEE